jgi:serine protease Do
VTTTAPTFADVVASVRSGIVRIETDDCSGGAIGTGFLLTPTLVATVEHVVDGATAISLKQEGRVVGYGTVVGADPARDLALIRSNTRLSGHDFTLASRAPQLGEDVAALGFPLGLPLTVTRGSVSGSGRTVPIGGLERRDLVQTDAAVNPGNSGGPLIADDGSVVGLVDLGTTQANGLAFAVSAIVAGPLLQAWRVAPQPVAPQGCGGVTQTQVVAPPATTTTATNEATAARDAVYTYWSDLQLGDYRSAFAILSSSEQRTLGGIGKWLSYYAGDPVQSVDVTLNPASVSGNTAYLSIASLRTVGAATGCKTWTGSYRLARAGSGWLIDYATLSPTPC